MDLVLSRTRPISPPTSPLIITVDGPTAAGKGTVSRALADVLGFAYLDTGLLYRVVAREVVDRGVRLDSHDVVTPSQQNRILEITKDVANVLTFPTLATAVTPELRTEAVSRGASLIAQLPGVRSVMLDLQRRLPCEMPPEVPGIVVDGRDMGTTVFPQAAVKFYVTASVQERAQRRFKELQERGELCTFQNVLSSLIQRDERDMTRDVSPLKPSCDAIIVDTTGQSPDFVVTSMLSAVKRALDISP